MIIPCIDLMGGKVVQLVQGREKKLELPDPLAVLAKFESYPQIQVIALHGFGLGFLPQNLAGFFIIIEQRRHFTYAAV